MRFLWFALSPFVSVLYFLFLSKYSLIEHIYLAGLPATTTFEGIDLTDYALASAIPDVTNFATEADVYNAVVTGVQVATGAIPVFTEGNCIDITSNVISWETTAGITDIQMVTALPQDPVSSVLYIIPEA